MTTITDRSAPAVVTVDRRHVGTLTTTSTAEQRRAALLELADLIDTEDRYPGRGLNGQPLSSVVDLIVPPLASHRCADPVRVFNELVGAVAEKSRFNADEAEWARQRGLGTSAETLANVDERLQSDIDSFADALMGRPS